VITSLMLTLFLEALDQTIVGAALPRVIAALHGLDRYSWVVSEARRWRWVCYINLSVGLVAVVAPARLTAFLYSSRTVGWLVSR
jgi:hypothetical protein